MTLGILAAVAAAFANAFAIVLQACETRQTPAGEAGRPALFRRLLRRRRWLAGTALMVVAWPLQVLALGLTAITVVQPILAASQLILLVLARTRLNERIGRSEMAGAVAIVAGIVTIVVVAPHDNVSGFDPTRTAIVLGLVGLAAISAYLHGGRRAGLGITPVLAAGFGYAWIDFTNKLLSGALATAAWGGAALCLLGILAFGTLAFLEEMTALQRRPAVTVAPVVGAIQFPLPVLMALGAGAETWGSNPARITLLAVGLLLVTLGAVLLGRSHAVARVGAEEREENEPGRDHAEPRGREPIGQLDYQREA